MRMPRKQIARPPEPCKKSHRRRGVEPGNMCAAFQPAVRGAGSHVMRAMKGQVDFEWQMEVDRASQERKNTEREAHEETQKIKIRPGHTTPQAQHFTNATCRCGARAGIRDADPARRYLDPPGIDTTPLRRAAGGGSPLPFCPPF